MTDYIRRGQAIAPFGVGAIHVLKGSKAVVTAGLDFWFRDAGGEMARDEQLLCVRVHEPRLEERLGVSHFRLPPGPECNLGDGFSKLGLPLFRFPTWYVCPRCGHMLQSTLHTSGKLECHNSDCDRERLRQMSFAVACEAGHLQDFPWREWVHRDRVPACHGILSYKAGGSGSLDDIVIKCKTCGSSRSLRGVMGGDFGDKESGKPGYSALSSRLLSKADSDSSIGAAGEKFNCQGGRVWLGELAGDACDRPMRAILINATNAHYGQVASALWLPPGQASDGDLAIQERLGTVQVRSRIHVRRSLGDSEDSIAQDLKNKFSKEFGPISKDALVAAIRRHLGAEKTPTAQLPEGIDEEVALRMPEYAHLLKETSPEAATGLLVVRAGNVSLLPEWLHSHVESLSLVARLRETRAFYGFSRLLAQRPNDAPPYQSLLWKKLPHQKADRWLPASVVYGEGIFIRFKEKSLTSWETREEVLQRLKPLQDRYDRVAKTSNWKPQRATPRLVMLHTLAHTLIRRLSFECGYGSASLRERLYVSDHPEARMAGILVYTASGDSEGSMGGLVRMGEPANFGRLFESALEDAKWCSSDPVCTECGEEGGQGTDGLNIAACHCCALLPETSCEMFNRFLDRSTLNSFFESGAKP